MIRSRVILQTHSSLQELPAQDAVIRPACALVPSVLATVFGVSRNTAPVGTYGVIIAGFNDLAGGTIDALFALGDVVPHYHLLRGDAFLARIADGEEIATGDDLTFGANGEFVEAGSADTVVAVATEDCDMSSSSGGDADGFCRAIVVA